MITSTRRDLGGRLLSLLCHWRSNDEPCRIERVRRKRHLARLSRMTSEQIRRTLAANPAGQTLYEEVEKWSRSAPEGRINQPLPAGPDRHRASVIINTLERPEDLEQSLAALKEHGLGGSDELIVVVGPEDHASEAVVQNSGLAAMLLSCPERNLSLSRNIGLKASSGEFVVYMDDDASPEPGWLEALLEPFADSRIGVSSGTILNGEGRLLSRCALTNHLGESLVQLDEKTDGPNDAGSCDRFVTPVGCNMAWRRSVALELGGFDEAYTYYLEETDLAKRALDLGWRCKLAPASRVLHRLAQNPVRSAKVDPQSMVVLVRSQLHFMGKHAFGVHDEMELQAAVWRRVLVDLEKLSWAIDQGGTATAEQEKYMGMVSRAAVNASAHDS